jgi:hypothetical protein
MSITSDKAPRADVLPEPADDVVEPAVVETAPVEAEAPSEPEARAPQRYTDEGRERAARRYREIRDEARKADAEPAAEADTATDDGGDAAPEPAPEATDKATEAEPAKGPEVAAPSKHKIKVRGEEIELGLDEIIRRAQLATASEDTLEESKRRLQEATALLNEAKALRSQPPENQPGADKPASKQQPDPSQVTDQPEHQPGKAKDPEKLKSVVERIQVGDQDDAAQALLEFRDEIIADISNGKAVDPADLDKRVDARIAQRSAEMQTKAEMDGAVEQFTQRYKDVASNKHLASAGFSILKDEIIADLKLAGLSEQDYAPIRNDVTALAKAQRMLRNNGSKLRTFEELLEKTGTTMVAEFGLKPPAATDAKSVSQSQPKPTERAPVQTPDPALVQQRVEAKRATVQQPRTAGVRGTVQQAPRPRTALEIVQDMKRQRGFQVTR